VVSSTPRPHFMPGKDPVPILQEAGWATGSVWTGGNSLHHRDSIPDRPASSSVTILTELPGAHTHTHTCDIHIYIYKLINHIPNFFEIGEEFKTGEKNFIFPQPLPNIYIYI